MKRAVFILIFCLLAILVYARQVDSTNEGIAYASPGDYIIRSSGEKVVLQIADIDYARKQLGLNITSTNQNNQIKVSNNFSEIAIFVLMIIVVVFLIEWNIGKAIGKKVSRDAGMIIGVIGILSGFPLFAGIACIVYSRKEKGAYKGS